MVMIIQDNLMTKRLLRRLLLLLQLLLLLLLALLKHLLLNLPRRLMREPGADERQTGRPLRKRCVDAGQLEFPDQ